MTRLDAETIARRFWSKVEITPDVSLIVRRKRWQHI